MNPTPFDAHIAPNPNTMDRKLYRIINSSIVEELHLCTNLFDTQVTPNHNTVLHLAALFGQVDCVHMILKERPLLICRVNLNNENPLHIAVSERQYNIVEALIDHATKLDLEPESSGGALLAILREVNVDGDTALHLAVREGENELVRLLVKAYQDFQDRGNNAQKNSIVLSTFGE